MGDNLAQQISNFEKVVLGLIPKYKAQGYDVSGALLNVVQLVKEGHLDVAEARLRVNAVVRPIVEQHKKSTLAQQQMLMRKQQQQQQQQLHHQQLQAPPSMGVGGGGAAQFMQHQVPALLYQQQQQPQQQQMQQMQQQVMGGSAGQYRQRSSSAAERGVGVEPITSSGVSLKEEEKALLRDIEARVGWRNVEEELKGQYDYEEEVLQQQPRLPLINKTLLHDIAQEAATQYQVALGSPDSDVMMLLEEAVRARIDDLLKNLAKAATYRVEDMLIRSGRTSLPVRTTFDTQTHLIRKEEEERRKHEVKQGAAQQGTDGAPGLHQSNALASTSMAMLATGVGINAQRRKKKRRVVLPGAAGGRSRLQVTPQLERLLQKEKNREIMTPEEQTAINNFRRQQRDEEAARLRDERARSRRVKIGAQDVVRVLEEEALASNVELLEVLKCGFRGKDEDGQFIELQPPAE